MQLHSEDYNALGAFRYAMRKFLRFSKEFLATDAKLTPEQYEALLAIKNWPDVVAINVGELSERLQVRHHTAVGLLDKLAARKFITRKRAGNDRRQVNVRLTSLGDSVLRRAAVVHRAEIRERSSEMIDALKRLQA
jgi:DNA-binding MarR family transcriptional regulator